MNNEKWTEVDRYLTDRLAQPDAALDAAIMASDEAGLPGQHVTPSQGKFLQILAQVQGARSILEIGTLGGYSSIWLARALPEGGKLLSLELNPKNAEIARKNISRAGLDDVVEVRLGNAVDSLQQLADEGHDPFDFIFIDADIPDNPIYLDWALKFSRPGSIIVCDNVIRNGGVATPDSDDSKVMGAHLFCEQLGKEPRVRATALQTVSSKGYDGFSIALVVE